jgi:hypothetical protein
MGGEAFRDTIKTGLKNLVLDAGPSVRDLSRRSKDGFSALMEAAQVPANWTEDAKASALLTVIHGLVKAINNPRWRASAMAAFRIPAEDYVGHEYDSRSARWKALAEREGTDPADVRRRVENHRDYWQSAVAQLSVDLEDELRRLNRSPVGWQGFEDQAMLSRPPLPMSPAISFNRTEVLYEFSGYRGLQATSHRWLLAHEPVDHYDAVGWYYSDASAPVTIVPLANCTLQGQVHELPMGGMIGRLTFSHVLEPGEEYYFSYIARFNSNQPCRPTILYEVRAQEIRNLTIRAQFDVPAMPSRIWYFDVGTQTDGWQTPEDGAPQWLQVAPNGYVQHRFDVCYRGRQYGLKWEWPSPM